MGHKKNFFKSLGHTVKQGSKSIGHLFEQGEKKIEGAVSDVYKDVKGAVKYTGKHVIKDVDNLSSALSNPMLLLGLGAVVVVVMMNR